MPVLIRHRSAMSAAQYDESAPAASRAAKEAAGLPGPRYIRRRRGLCRCRGVGDAGAARHLVRRKREAKHSVRDHARSSRPSQRPHTVDASRAHVGSDGQPPAPAWIGSNRPVSNPWPGRMRPWPCGRSGPGEGTTPPPIGRHALSPCARGERPLRGRDCDCPPARTMSGQPSFEGGRGGWALSDQRREGTSPCRSAWRGCPVPANVR